jgi:hypothetical protein
MEDSLNSSGSDRYVQATIRLQPKEAFTTQLELHKALNGTLGVEAAVVEAEEVVVSFDPEQISEESIESLLRQTGREPAEVELTPAYSSFRHHSY